MKSTLVGLASRTFLTLVLYVLGNSMDIRELWDDMLVVYSSLGPYVCMCCHLTRLWVIYSHGKRSVSAGSGEGMGRGLRYVN